MIDYQKEFLDWLEKNPDKKKGLTRWDYLARIINNDETSRRKSLEINFEFAMSISREWQNAKNRFLEYWKVLYWWAATEKHDGFCDFGLGFRELDYFIRHYQNSTEELIAQIKQLKSEKERLEKENANLKETMDIERETNQESAEAMDNFYRMAPPREDLALANILKKFSEDYLTLNWENRQKDQKVKQLEETIKISNRILEQECQTKEKQQKEILKTVSSLAEQLTVGLQIQEEQTEAQIQVPPK